MKQKSNKQQIRSVFGWLGGLVILVGIIFLISEMSEIQIGANLWPLRIIVPGVVLLCGTLFMDKEIGAALSIVSNITIMSGLILLVHVLTGYWATWPYSWTLLFPTSIGLGLFAYGLAKSKQDLHYVGSSLTKLGLALFMVFTVFFEFILGIGGFGLAYGWPLLLVSLGYLTITLSGFNFEQIDSLLSNSVDNRLGIGNK